MWIRWTGSKLLQKMWFVGQNLADCGLLTARGHLGFWEKRTKIPFWDFWNFFEKSLQAMYQGSHLPNFEALSVPQKKAKRGQTNGKRFKASAILNNPFLLALIGLKNSPYLQHLKSRLHEISRVIISSFTRLS